jgi:hypothetical protein
MALQDLLKGFQTQKTEQVGALQNFNNNLFNRAHVQGPQKPTAVPSQNATFPTTSAGVKTPQQSPGMGSVVDYLSSKGQASDFGSRTALAGQYGISNYTGTASQNTQLLRALQGQTTPGYNPSSVNISIDETIPSDALKNGATSTGLQEKRKQDQSKTLDTRFGKEEEKLLKEIASFKLGLANLQGTQAKEYANLEDNPEGVFGGVLGSQLNRLSKDQALELNARTGQLNAYLDTLELYQGYRPQMVGSPQIDETTGNAFAYVQDPMTGEITTQDLGQLMTPNPYANALTMSEGQTLVDPITGEVIRSIPKTYAPKEGSGLSFSGFTSGQKGELDWENPDTIDSLPISTITKAVMSGTGSVKDLTPTLKAQVLSEMYSVGYNPGQVVGNKLNQLVDLWEAMPSDQKGLLQGAKFWASKTVPEVGQFESAKTLLTRQIARLYDVGVLSDMDVKNYKDAMPSRYDSGIDVVKAKVAGITQASTGKKSADQYTEGMQAELDDGRIATYRGGKWVDDFTGQTVKID